MKKHIILLASALSLSALALAKEPTIDGEHGIAAEPADNEYGIGAKADKAMENVRVFPNPFVNDVRITKANGCILRIYTRSGILVHTKQLESDNEILPLSDLASGIYLFRISQPRPLKGEVGLKVIKR